MNLWKSGFSIAKVVNTKSVKIKSRNALNATMKAVTSSALATISRKGECYIRFVLFFIRDSISMDVTTSSLIWVTNFQKRSPIKNVSDVRKKWNVKLFLNKKAVIYRVIIFAWWKRERIISLMLVIKEILIYGISGPVIQTLKCSETKTLQKLLVVSKKQSKKFEPNLHKT